MTDVQRDLGRLEAQLDAHAERHDRIEAKIDELAAKVDRLAGYADRSRGAWAFILAASALITGMVEAARAFLGK